MRADICVATHRRPAGLRSLLCSLAEQKTDSLDLRVIVVDNDPEQSAKPVVEAVSTATQLRIVYTTEARQGLSFVRNRALECVEADLFGFLDDDEVAPDTWLVRMRDALVENRADVAFGPVISDLPSGAPKWARANQCFNRPRFQTGTALTTGATNNVLAWSKVLMLGGNRMFFNEALALRSGEDTEFFYRLHRNGAKLIWCNEAPVKESVDLQRLTIWWVLRRSLRGGQGYADVFLRDRNLLVHLLWIAGKSLQTLVAIAILPLLLLFSRSQFVRLACRIAGAVGQVSIFILPGVYYEEYNRSRYHRS